MSNFGDIRSACHARDLRALLDCYDQQYDGYVRDVLPEYEHEVWVWTLTMCMHLITRTSLTIEMARGFAATWAEWMLAGARGIMPIQLRGKAYGMLDCQGFLSHNMWISDCSTRGDDWRAVWVARMRLREVMKERGL